jgi:diacylglycerol kinase family enzyme
VRRVPRIVLIVNPFASSVTPRVMEAVEGELRAGGEVRTLLTQRPGHAVELVAEASGNADAIVVLSGDGGYNEAINGADGTVPIGFLPGGGTSVLARALGLPREPQAAARVVTEALAAERTRTITLGRVNGRRFAFSAGLGFDAELVRRVDALGRGEDGRRAGDLAFIRAAAAIVLQSHARFEPAIDIAGFGRAAFAIIANCDPYSYAGSLPLRVAPGARFELGLDFAAPELVRPIDVPRLVAFLVSGRFRLGGRIVNGHDLDAIEIRCDRPLPLHVDGEDLGDVEEAIFEAERDALPVLV